MPRILGNKAPTLPWIQVVNQWSNRIRCTEPRHMEPKESVSSVFSVSDSKEARYGRSNLAVQPKIWWMIVDVHSPMIVNDCHIMSPWFLDCWLLFCWPIVVFCNNWSKFWAWHWQMHTVTENLEKKSRKGLSWQRSKCFGGQELSCLMLSFGWLWQLSRQTLRPSVERWPKPRSLQRVGCLGKRGDGVSWLWQMPTLNHDSQVSEIPHHAKHTWGSRTKQLNLHYFISNINQIVPNVLKDYPSNPDATAIHYFTKLRRIRSKRANLKTRRAVTLMPSDVLLMTSSWLQWNSLEAWCFFTRGILMESWWNWWNHGTTQHLTKFHP